MTPPSEFKLLRWQEKVEKARLNGATHIWIKAGRKTGKTEYIRHVLQETSKTPARVSDQINAYIAPARNQAKNILWRRLKAMNRELIDGRPGRPSSPSTTKTGSACSCSEPTTKTASAASLSDPPSSTRPTTCASALRRSRRAQHGRLEISDHPMLDTAQFLVHEAMEDGEGRSLGPDPRRLSFHDLRQPHIPGTSSRGSAEPPRKKCGNRNTWRTRPPTRGSNTASSPTTTSSATKSRKRTVSAWTSNTPAPWIGDSTTPHTSCGRNFR